MKWVNTRPDAPTPDRVSTLERFFDLVDELRALANGQPVA